MSSHSEAISAYYSSLRCKQALWPEPRPGMRIKICPTCKRRCKSLGDLEIHPRSGVFYKLKYLSLRGQEQKIIWICTLRKEKIVSYGEIQEALWPVADRQPDYWHNVITKTLFFVRRELKQVPTLQLVTFHGVGVMLTETPNGKA